MLKTSQEIILKNAPFSGAAIFAITYHKTLIINTDV